MSRDGPGGYPDCKLIFISDVFAFLDKTRRRRRLLPLKRNASSSGMASRPRPFHSGRNGRQRGDQPPKSATWCMIRARTGLMTFILRLYKALGKARWAIRFSRWYRLSLKHEQAIAKLLPIVERCFEHQWVASVELKLRPSPGHDTVLGKKVPERPMHLDAPVTVTILRKKKGRKRQALCMSFYVLGNTIYVVQLQGVRGQDLPAELRSWPALFVTSLQKLASNEKFKEIRIAKARTLGSYRYPDVKRTARETIEQTEARIRKNMQSRYDGTASTLGFIERRRWWVWRTPDRGEGL